MIFSDLYGDYLDRELGTVDRTVAFTTIRRKAVINEGMREFNRLTECFTREASIALTDDVAEYDLEASITAGDYLRVAKQGVEIKAVDASANETYFAGDEFPRRDIVWLNRFQPGWRTATAGNPLSHYFREEGGRVYFGIYPPPSVAVGETWTGTIPYVALPPDMTADADVPFTVSSNAKLTLRDWHKAIVHFGAGQLEKFVRKNQQGYLDQMQLFGGYVSDYIAKQHPKGGQHVTFARTYYRGRGGRVMDPRRWP